MSFIPNTKRGTLARFALGGGIVILFTAATTAVAGLLQFKQIANDLGGTPSIKHANVTIANPGNPQTILIVGSDHRWGEPASAANTDTMMLVRLDPDSSTINVLSVPRDLRVQIQTPRGAVTQKLNAAFSLGGTGLLLRTLKDNVFPDLQVNHIVDVTFGGFEALVNTIGCVYTDVDHRYYNNTAVTNYSSIDIQPGYQKLCGPDALAFVRFRHTDNDLVRNARQQDFIRWAKDQYGASQLVANRDMLLRVFGQHTQTDRDLHTVDGLINLFNLVAFSAGHQLKQIKFPAQILPCGPVPAGANTALQQTPCYVTADPIAEQRAFDALMTPTYSQPGPANRPAPPGPRTRPGGGGPPKADVAADIADARSQAAALGNAGMPVYVPGVIANGTSYCASGAGGCFVEQGQSAGSYPRAYQIRDQSGNAYPAYRLTLVQNEALGEYYGIQGTTWKNPPILNNPTETRTVAGKRLQLYANGGRITVVAWKSPKGVYWVSNTLTSSLSNQQMIAIGASLTPAG